MQVVLLLGMDMLNGLSSFVACEIVLRKWFQDPGLEWHSLVKAYEHCFTGQAE